MYSSKTLQDAIHHAADELRKKYLHEKRLCTLLVKQNRAIEDMFLDLLETCERCDVDLDLSKFQRFADRIQCREV